jgi:hypothetical protein
LTAKVLNRLSRLDAELKVVITCTVIALVLLGLFLFIDNVVFGPEVKKRYSLLVSGNTTYQVGNLTLVVGNNGNDSPKVMSIYGLDNKTQPKIFASFLSAEKIKTINESRIHFGGLSLLLIRNVTNLPKILEFSVEDFKQVGSYHGWMYLSGENNYQIPITVTTEPKVIRAIILVLIGVLISIAFWEYFTYHNSKKYNKLKQKLPKEAKKLSQDADEIAEIAEVLPDAEQAWAPSYRNDAAELRTKVRSKLSAAYVAGVKETKLKKRYLVDTAKIATLDIATIGFGIAIGLIGLLNNNYVTGIIDISSYDVAILIGIGLGIGSLKEFVDKPA